MGAVGNTHAGVEEARAAYDADQAEIHKELMHGIGRAIGDTVPKEALGEVETALKAELKIIEQRRNDARDARLARAADLQT
ncbi:hypothetical protein EES41_39550 (plasmid) [Streptomyces sp. ADI95-16]|uniref:hypothetical protein n=1 Tax=Streptomyces sp. ADI95-16 TaxID=1522758 RepID=UPI000F3A9840|nr:hypothetical protein [Streptomyces sp. ADI95-16]AYV32870.1 hypothetical protein EES41_39550 [Streptomyces sp. ADI95-16]